MEIKIKHDKLTKALNYVSKGVSTKPNIPVLSNVLLTVEKGMLQLSSTNLDMGINVWLAGQVGSEGKTTVAAKILADFVSVTSSEKAVLNLVNSSLTVKTDNSEAQFQTIPAEEFPILPKAVGEPTISVQPQQFSEALAKVVFACSTDNAPGKSQQTGVYFKLSDEDNVLTLVGLDSYRLSEKKLKVKRKQTSSFEAIVPAKALQELIRIVEAETDAEQIDVYLNESNTQILFKFNEIEFSIRLLEGPYPDYHQVIPSDVEYQFAVEKTELEKAVKVINTFARSVLGNRTEFDFEPDQGTIKLSSTVTDLGSNSTEVKIYNPQGQALKSAYNLRYLAEMTAVISGKRLTFETRSALSAAVFRDGDDPDFLHLIMPLKRDS